MTDRFLLSTEGHLVQALPPQNISGGVTSAAVNTKNYRHIGILIGFGALSAAPGLITLQLCTSQAGANPTAIPFILFAQETANGDVLSAATPVTAVGYQPPATSNINYYIGVDTSSLPSNSPTTGSPLGLNYLRVSIADGSNTDFAAIFFVLSGPRYAGDQSPTVLV